ncbi:hypothetical protein NS337_00600 [Pseudomonas oryzihabitans]|uniref:hypothetical protein n=1 Tax=Pseudomonas oryzihabitans TaxID=47885 RepID=UPI000736BC50|nr:hypothetical protein [Pseudomonas psychrotolerans]KTT57176.1 hypothetical protein NS337_00600 [Pseudomonas psychrotolerans]
MSDIPVHPELLRSERAQALRGVTMKAYEVYVHLFASQEALVTGGCRGGFCAGELVALLYARAFPKQNGSYASMRA